MRRLVLIVTCIAALGVGAAVWISGASATVARRPVPRLTRTLTVPQPAPSTCYVAGGGCSVHPCVEFVSPDAVYRPGAPVTGSKCRPTAPRVTPVAVGVVSAQAVR